MKRIFALLLLLLTATSGYGQKLPTHNLGGTASKNYCVSIPCSYRGGWNIIPVVIQGKTYRFLLDTGSSTMVSGELAEALKLQPVDEIPVADQGGRRHTLQVFLLSGVSLGGIVFDGIPTMLLPDSEMRNCLELDGVIGSNLLRNSVVRFSVKDSTVILADDIRWLPGELPEKESSEVVLTPSQSRPFLGMTLKDKGTGELPVLFDSGCTDLFDLSLDHFRELWKNGVFSETSVLDEVRGSNSFGFSGKADDSTMYDLRIPELKLNRFTWKRISVSTTTASESRIGVRIFSYGTVTLDYPGRRFYFVPDGKNETDMYEKINPVGVSTEEGRLVIGFVRGDRLKAQIHAGDRVLAIDDTDFENLSGCELFNFMFTFRAPDTYRLKVQGAEGGVKEITVEKE